MARLIALDASVAIAALSLQDAHHGAASAALTSIEDADELVLGATTRTEILIGPHRIRGRALQAALDFIGGCATIPVTAPIADAAAVLKATHSPLSVPNAVTLAVANAISADAVWTFDQRRASVDARVRVPAAAGP